MSYSGSNLLTSAAVLTVFERTIIALGGSVHDRYLEDDLLLTRSILPRSEEVQLGDRIHHGVALRASRTNLSLHPYTFREVCKNGAIMATTLGSHEIDLSEFGDAPAAEQELVSAIQASAHPSVFQQITRHLREGMRQPADLAITLMPYLHKLSGARGAEVVRAIAERLQADGDLSRYGLFNAVTAVARETRDPGRRWELEELGGSLALLTPGRPSRDPARAWIAAKEPILV